MHLPKKHHKKGVLGSVLLAWVLLFLVLPIINAETEYMLIGVSGGLQEGFPAHSKLHYEKEGEQKVKALFLGRGLVRGYKAFLDVMEPGWREYLDSEDPNQQPVINSNVFASGCYEHANEYWLYLVDSRQTLAVLMNEPRFLSITPDTGFVELQAKETSPLVKQFFQTHFQQQSRQHIENVAIPLVTCVHFQENSHIPSPPMYRHDDGTLVTNFPDSLALWAKVDDRLRTAVLDTTKRCKASDNDKENEDCSPQRWAQAVKDEQIYWQTIRNAIRHAEQHRPTPDLVKLYAPPFQCQKKVRFGVGPNGNAENNTRVNYPFTNGDIQGILNPIGYTVDFDEGEIVSVMEDGQGSKVQDNVPDL